MALSLNKQKEKDWYSLIKQEAKAFEWKFKGWFAYKTIKDYFYEMTFSASGTNDCITGSLAFKPLIIDETFWDIVDLSDNKKMPLSFRAEGAFIVGSKDVFDFNLKVVVDDFKNVIDDLFTKANFKVEELQSAMINLDSFASFIEQHPNQRSEWFDKDLLIVTFIVQKEYDKALTLLEYAKRNRGRARWGFGDKDFYDLGIEYCQIYQ